MPRPPRQHNPRVETITIQYRVGSKPYWMVMYNELPNRSMGAVVSDEDLADWIRAQGGNEGADGGIPENARVYSFNPGIKSREELEGLEEPTVGALAPPPPEQCYLINDAWVCW